jgi:pimeloyl-ACP methyl ester carboxylesterase
VVTPRIAMQLTVEPFIFDCPGQGRSHTNQPIITTPMKLAAKRYTVGASFKNTRGLTLLFAHCIGSHKEQWEPVIARLFALAQEKEAAHRIREAWAIDCQSHGDSAVLNAAALNSRPDGISAFEWAEGIASIVGSSRMTGHRIVPIGHSAGGGAVTLTTLHLPTHPPPYAALILVEPTIVTREVYHGDIENRQAQMDFAVGSTRKRRDKWPSKSDARSWMGSRWPWKNWDSRALDLFVEHGLHPDSEGGVTLKTPREHEALTFQDTEAHFHAVIQLAQICHIIPVHLIWSEHLEIIPISVQDSLSDASEGRVVASITRVPEAGHLVTQEKPDALADAISAVLDRVLESRCPVSKL